MDLKCLPVEMLEKIFSFSLNPQLAFISSHIYSQLSSPRIRAAFFIAKEHQRGGSVSVFSSNAWAAVPRAWKCDEMLSAVLFMTISSSSTSRRDTNFLIPTDHFFVLRLAVKESWISSVDWILKELDSKRSSTGRQQQDMDNIFAALLKINAYTGCIPITRSLLQQNNHNLVSLLSIEEYAPLRIACAAGHLPLVQILIEEFGCEAGIGVKSGYCQRMAAVNGHFAVVEYLVRRSELKINKYT